MIYYMFAAVQSLRNSFLLGKLGSLLYRASNSGIYPIILVVSSVSMTSHDFGGALLHTPGHHCLLGLV